LAIDEGLIRMTKRKRYSAEFKAKVALEAIREELTTAELAKKYDIHPTMITAWKRTAIENMASAFDGKDTAEPTISAGEVEKLHAKIGQLVVERDFLSAASSLILSYAGKWVTGLEKAAYRGGCRSLPELPKGTIRHGEDYRYHRLSSAGIC
jgi:transposase